MSFRPPPSTWIAIFPAPASSEFSINSLTTDAGRSTTSPAAMRFAMSSGSTLILGILKLVCEDGLLSRGAAEKQPYRYCKLTPFIHTFLSALRFTELNSDLSQLLLGNRRR